MSLPEPDDERAARKTGGLEVIAAGQFECERCGSAQAWTCGLDSAEDGFCRRAECLNAFGEALDDAKPRLHLMIWTTAVLGNHVNINVILRVANRRATIACTDGRDPRLGTPPVVVDLVDPAYRPLGRLAGTKAPTTHDELTFDLKLLDRCSHPEVIVAFYVELEDFSVSLEHTALLSLSRASHSPLSLLTEQGKCSALASTPASPSRRAV